MRVEVRGNHDPAGTEQLNSVLARSRAENVEAALISLGVPAARLAAVPEDKDRETCAAVKEEERLFCRSASFRVIGAPVKGCGARTRACRVHNRVNAWPKDWTGVRKSANTARGSACATNARELSALC